MGRRNPETRAALALLRDGEWHDLLSIVAAVGHLIPPEKAYRFYGHNKQGAVKNGTVQATGDQRILGGRIYTIRGMLSQLMKYELVERSGPHRCNNPSFRITPRGMWTVDKINGTTRTKSGRDLFLEWQQQQQQGNANDERRDSDSYVGP